jgi:GT2 family glycosyltransferase
VEVSAVVLALDSADTLPATLSSLAAQEPPPDEVVVVDGGSADGTQAVARDGGARLVVEPRRGIARARDRGVAESSGRVVLFVDADVELGPGCLCRLLAALGGRTAVATARMEARGARTLAERLEAARTALHFRRAPARAPSWCTAYTRELLEAVGRFDGSLPTGEDLDLLLRAEAKGYSSAYVPEAVAYHRHRSSIGAYLRQHFGYGVGQGRLVRKHGLRNPRNTLFCLGGLALGPLLLAAPFSAAAAAALALDLAAFLAVEGVPLLREGLASEGASAIAFLPLALARFVAYGWGFARGVV